MPRRRVKEEFDACGVVIERILHPLESGRRACCRKEVSLHQQQVSRYGKAGSAHRGRLLQEVIGCSKIGLTELLSGSISMGCVASKAAKR